MITTTVHHASSAPFAEVPAFERSEGTSVHLFSTDGLSAEAVARIGAVLSPDEHERAGRFRFERDRHTFVLTRAALRWLLAAQLERRPEALAFDYNEFGKPALPGVPQLHFNVSHSAGVAAVALSPHGKVGVDVERVASERAALDAAQRFFAASEWKALQACDPGTRHELFFLLWTLKEAYVKAKDKGLSIALDSFEFAATVANEPLVQFKSSLGDRAEDWQFRSGHAFATYRWSLAVHGVPTATQALQVFRYG